MDAFEYINFIVPQSVHMALIYLYISNFAHLSTIKIISAFEWNLVLFKYLIRVLFFDFKHFSFVVCVCVVM